MLQEKVKRNWTIDKDVLVAFEEWTEATEMKMGPASQLALWVLMQLTPDERQGCLDEMKGRHDQKQGAGRRRQTSVLGARLFEIASRRRRRKPG